MADEDINPYESPQVVTETRGGGKGNWFAGGLVRVLMMGLIGYGSFAVVGLLYFVAAEYFQLEIFPSLRWALGVGVVGAVIFAGSEALNTGRGSTARFLPRMLGAVVVFVVSTIASSSFSDLLGWRPRTYGDEGHWLKELLLAIAVYFAVLVVARVVWIGALRQKRATDEHG